MRFVASAWWWCCAVVYVGLRLLLLAKFSNISRYSPTLATANTRLLSGAAQNNHTRCNRFSHRNECGQTSDAYRVFQKTDTQFYFYFWDNFGNSAPILTTFSLLQAEIYGA